MLKIPFKPFMESYPRFRLYDDGFLVLLGYQHAGGEGRLDHVDDEVVGQDVQLLHLVPGHVGAACDAITEERRETWHQISLLHTGLATVNSSRRKITITTL